MNGDGLVQDAGVDVLAPISYPASHTGVLESRCAVDRVAFKLCDHLQAAAPLVPGFVDVHLVGYAPTFPGGPDQVLFQDFIQIPHDAPAGYELVFQPGAALEAFGTLLWGAGHEGGFWEIDWEVVAFAEHNVTHQLVLPLNELVTTKHPLYLTANPMYSLVSPRHRPVPYYSLYELACTPATGIDRDDPRSYQDIIEDVFAALFQPPGTTAPRMAEFDELCVKRHYPIKYYGPTGSVSGFPTVSFMFADGFNDQVCNGDCSALAELFIRCLQTHAVEPDANDPVAPVDGYPQVVLIRKLQYYTPAVTATGYGEQFNVPNTGQGLNAITSGKIFVGDLTPSLLANPPNDPGTPYPYIKAEVKTATSLLPSTGVPGGAGSQAFNYHCIVQISEAYSAPSGTVVRLKDYWDPSYGVAEFSDPADLLQYEIESLAGVSARKLTNNSIQWARFPAAGATAASLRYKLSKRTVPVGFLFF